MCEMESNRRVEHFIRLGYSTQVETITNVTLHAVARAEGHRLRTSKDGRLVYTSYLAVRYWTRASGSSNSMPGWYVIARGSR